jgi:tRNA A37 threonylcarbamoyladenosine dehydratase
MLNEFSRTELLIGKQAMQKLGKSRVAICGIGGVGSFAAEALTRAGVGKLVLIDDDSICLTNLNRQIHATHKTVGQPKVEAMRERIQAINPRAEVETFKCFYAKDNSDDLVREDYDYIIDAIDTVTSKIELVVKAYQKNINIISSMGAGNKLDPSRLEIDDIYNTAVCPLAKVMRKELRARGIPALKVVYSREEPLKPIPGKVSNCNEGCIYPPEPAQPGTIRRQTPGSISFVPSVAGLLMAGQVVRDLI